MADATKTVQDLGFEEALAELEQIVNRIEGGQGTLDDAIQAYERGDALKRHCQKRLDAARMRVEQIRLPQNGAPEVADFQGET